MMSERVQRQIDRLLDQAEQALEQGSLDIAREKAQLVLGMDAENADALAYLAAVERAIGIDRKSTRLNSSHIQKSRMPSSA